MMMTEEEASARVDRPDNLVNIIAHRRSRTEQDYSSGRKVGDKNLPEPIRELVTTIAATQGPTVAARATGVSVAQAHALGNGKHSSADTMKDPSIEGRAQEAIGRVNDKALEILMLSMGLLTPEKLQSESPRVISGVARDMASVMEKTTPREKEDRRTQVLIYAPVSKTEQHYEVTEVDADVVE